MKYLLFAGDDQYPRVFPGDYKGAFDSIEEAKAYVEDKSYDWAGIFTFDGAEFNEILALYTLYDGSGGVEWR